MSTASIPVLQSNHDGSVSWTDNAAASPAGLFTQTVVYPFVGPHYATANVQAAFFIFKVDNMPQGSVLNSCKIEIRTGNAYTGGLTNHIYVAVENNLDPTGTGAVVSGTLGSMPWQRLGRQSAATTLLSYRCGPTHNKAGQTLANYGAHVRDTSALIYKAYCTDQATASTLGRDLAGYSDVQTEDFKPALQALINDPSWNSTSQYIMMYLFADASSGSALNVGNLTGITWNNGTAASSTGYGNGGGQITYYDSGTPPKLLLDYTVTTIRSIGGGSTSSGNARLTKPLLLGQMRYERAETTALGNPVIPKLTTGAHDRPITGMSGVANPNDISWLNGSPLAARVKLDTQRNGRVDGYCLSIEDYYNNTPLVWWDIGAYQSTYSTRDVYSLRFYHRYEQEAYANVYPHVATFSLAGVTSFKLEYQQYISGTNYNELRIVWTGGDSGWTTYRFTTIASGNFYRYEIQVDANQTPKVRVRVYLNDATTSLATLTASPPTVAIDKVLFGNYDTSLLEYSYKISDFEMWTDYLLNRQYPDSLTNTVGTPYIPQKWAWFEYNGTTSSSLEDLGTIASIAGGGGSVVMTSPANPLVLEDHTGEVATGGTTPYTLYSNLGYGTGTGRRLDLYVPIGTAPPGGWPVIMWTHGGFWISGNRNIIPLGFVRDCCLRGYAVASCSYVLTSLYSGPPTWDPNGATGFYPSFIINYKEAAYSIQNTHAPTYNLNPAKVIASGHSAGGYNALGAVVSKGVTNDGSSRDLTLAGNVAKFGSPNVADPSFIGAYIFCGPVDIAALKLWDPSNPDWPYGGTGVGTIWVTARIFMGQSATSGSGDVTNTNLDALIVSNAANIPSIAYAWGTSDHLVVSNPFTPYSQQAKLTAAFAAAAGSLPATTTYDGHEVPDALHHTLNDADFDFGHFFRWLDNLPGLH